MFSLGGKNAVVTGGGSGIGLAISKAFAQQGAHVNILEVNAEAGDGLDRGILVPVMLENVRLPLAFRRWQAARLLDWPKRKNQPELQLLSVRPR